MKDVVSDEAINQKVIFEVDKDVIGKFDQVRKELELFKQEEEQKVNQEAKEKDQRQKIQEEKLKL